MRFLPPLKDFYCDQKDSVKSAIDDAFKKYEGEPSPAPIRGPVLLMAKPTGNEEADDDAEDAEVDLMPRKEKLKIISQSFPQNFFVKIWPQNKKFEQI